MSTRQIAMMFLVFCSFLAISCADRSGLKDDVIGSHVVFGSVKSMFYILDGDFHHHFWYSDFVKRDVFGDYVDRMPGVLLLCVTTDGSYSERNRKRVSFYDGSYFTATTDLRLDARPYFFSVATIDGRFASPLFSGCVVVFAEEGDFVVNDVDVFGKIRALYDRAQSLTSKISALDVDGPLQGVDADVAHEYINARSEALSEIRDIISQLRQRKN